MTTDISIVVVEATRLSAIRDGMNLPGRVLHFTTGNLSGALDSIRTFRPKLVAVDALWAQTLPGVAFIERVEDLRIAEVDVRLVARLEGRWVTTARRAAPGAAEPAVAAASRPQIVVAPDPAIAAVQSGAASLVDISVLGAQVVSKPVLRPNQKIKIALPDTGDMLQVMALVAWSRFEKPHLDAQYRAGLEFTGAAQQALEDYRLRHCAAEPIPYRG